MVVLDWDNSFSMQAYVTNPGYQRMALTGYITEQRADGLYAAPILPQLFYGADGNQLTTWRQYLPTAGSQTILSRSGGQPSIPKHELSWRKVTEVEKETTVAVEPTPAKLEISPTFALILGLIGGAILLKIIGGK